MRKKKKNIEISLSRSKRKKERKKNHSFYLCTWSSVCPFSSISLSLSLSLATYISPKSMPFIISRCTVSDDGEARRIYGVFSTEYPFQYTTYTVERWPTNEAGARRSPSARPTCSTCWICRFHARLHTCNTDIWWFIAGWPIVTRFANKVHPEFSRICYHCARTNGVWI